MGSRNFVHYILKFVMMKGIIARVHCIIRRNGKQLRKENVKLPGNETCALKSFVMKTTPQVHNCTQLL